MRIVIISQKERHSEFPFRHTFYEAGERPTFNAIRPPELDRTLEQDDTPVDLFIIEALQNEESAARVLKQVQNAAPDNPTFIIYHSEAEPKAPAERAALKQRFLDLGATGFADVGLDAFTFSGALLQAAGVKPQYQIIPPERAIVPIGDFHFDLVARKAYFMGGDAPDADNDEERVATKDTWAPIGFSVQRILFNARSKNGRRLFGPEMREGAAQTYYEGRPYFDLTEEEARLVDVLRADNRQYYEPKLLILDMYNSEFSTILPEAATIREMRDRITSEIAKYVDNAERYILFSEDKGYMLNEPSLEIDPELTAEEMERQRAEIEELLVREMYPHFEDDHPSQSDDNTDAPSGKYQTYAVPERKFLLHDALFVNLKRGVITMAGASQGAFKLDDAECLILDYLEEHTGHSVTASQIIDNTYSSPHKPDLESFYEIVSTFNSKFSEHFGVDIDIVEIGRDGGFSFGRHTSNQFQSTDQPDPSDNL